MWIRRGLSPERIGAALRAAVIGTLVIVSLFVYSAFQSGDIGFHHNDLTYNSLDYDAAVQPNGDLRITEHIDMKLNKRKGGEPWRQLYQRYTLRDKVKNDGVLSAITDVSVTNVSTGQKYRHGSASSSRDLYNYNWDGKYAGQWYAADFANAHDNEGDEYLPAAMNDAQYKQKTAELKQEAEQASAKKTNSGETAGEQSQQNQAQVGQSPNQAQLGQSQPVQNGSGNDGNAAAEQNSGDGTPAASNSSNTNSGDNAASGSDSATPDSKADASGNKTDTEAGELRDENGEVASMGKSGDTVEIGWNIPATQSAKSLKFDVSMTFKDVVKVYNDVAYFKWEPLGDANGVPIGDFRAKVTLPKGVKSADGRQWMHYAGKGSVKQTGSRQIDMSAQNVPASRHIDLVSMFSASPMNKDVKYRIVNDGKKLVLDREADEKRKAADDVVMRRNVILGYLGWEGAALLFALVAVLITNWQAYYPKEHHHHAAARSKRKKKNRRKKPVVNELEQVPYSQTIPDMTPACAAKFIDFLDFGEYSDDFKARQMSSTLLSLVSKGVIAVYPGHSEWFKGIDLSRASDEEISQRLRDVSEVKKKDTELAEASAGKLDDEAQRVARQSRDEEYIRRARAQGFGKGIEAVREVLSEASEDPKVSSKPTSTVVMLPGSFAQNVSETHNLTLTERALLNFLREISLKLNTPVFDFRTISHKLENWWKAEWLQSVFNWTAQFEYVKLHVVQPLLFGFAAAAEIVAAIAMGSLYAYGFAFDELGVGTDDYGHVCDQLHGQWGVSLLLGAPVIFLLIFLLKLLRYRGLTRKGKRLVAPMLGLKKYLSDGGDGSSDRAVVSGSGSAPGSSPLSPLSPDKFDKYYVYATALGLSDYEMERFGGLFSSIDNVNGRQHDDSLSYWYYYPHDFGGGASSGSGSSLSAQFSDLAAGISNGIDTMESTFSVSSGSGGGSGGGSFGGSGGGSGGGSFGGR